MVVGLSEHHPPYYKTGLHILQQVSQIVSHRLTQSPQTSCRTCRIDSIEKNGLDFAKNLGLQNIRDLRKLIQVRSIPQSHSYAVLILFLKWNEDNKYDPLSATIPRLTQYDPCLQDSVYAPIFGNVPFCLSREIRLFP